MMVKTVIMLQARLGSSRLPQKVLLPLGDKTVVECAMSALLEIPAEKYILVTDSYSSLALSPLARKWGFETFIGSEKDVLKRFASASREFPSEIIIRATADNPLVSAEAGSHALQLFDKKNADYVTLDGLPVGCGVEVIRTSALLQADKEAHTEYDREHVCPYLYKNPDRFKIVRVKAPKKWFFPDLSLTIDELSEYQNIYNLFNQIYKGNPLKIGEFLPFLPKKIRFLFYPSIRDGNGTGHIVRCMRLAQALGDSAFYGEDSRTLQTFFQKAGFFYPYFITEHQVSQVDFIIVDQRELEKLPLYLENLKKNVIALDEGGSFRSEADFLIDSLPSFLTETANIEVSPLFSFEEKRLRDDIANIPEFDLLISFGGEDPEDLVFLVVNEISLQMMIQYKITVVLGPNYKGSLNSFKQRGHFSKIEWILAPDSLERFLKSSKIVLTSFGLTAYEALSYGKELILLEPSKYHHLLAKKVNFESYQVGKISKLMKSLIQKLEKYQSEGMVSPCFSLEVAEKGNILAHLTEMVPPAVLECPFCGGEKKKSLVRFSSQSYFKCKSCGTFYQKNFKPTFVDYGENYFFEEYEKQYGKSYLEDFQNIYKMGLLRCQRILKRRKEEIQSLLDLGAAYGHFLAAGEKMGWKVMGVDISPNAVAYLKEKGYFALNSDLRLLDASACCDFLDEERFDVVTLWYVIEHFSSTDFLWQLLPKVLKKGGVFAFSTPNLKGISGLKNKRNFLRKNPADHYFILSPRIVRQELKKRGFSNIRFYSTGHHPERFYSSKKTIFLLPLFKLVSRVFRLGDTFECYAVYKGNLDE